MKSILMLLSVPFLTLALGCGGSSEPDSRSAAPAATEPTSVEATGARAQPTAGYRHQAARSAFPLRGNVVELEESGFRKTIGQDGVFAIDLVNGAAYAVPNANAELARSAPLTRDPAEHNARVREYFRQAGLPDEQIADVHVTTLMRSHGRAGEPDPEPEFVGFTTVVSRSIDGIPVPESHAWARLNASGQVVSEAVFWPELPKRVVDEAKALSLLVNDRAALDRLRSKVGISDGNVTVGIHHAPAALSRPTEEATAVADFARSTQGTGLTRHFLASGEEVFLSRDAK
jgi:hypothetical protein